MNKTIYLSSFCILLPLLVTAADAESPMTADQVYEALEPDTQVLDTTVVISRRQAFTLVTDEYQGRVLSIVMDNDGLWRVRLDQGGTVFNVFVDSRSGELSRPTEPQ